MGTTRTRWSRHRHHTRPGALAAALARVVDLRRAGILTSSEAKAMRTRILADATASSRRSASA